MKSAELLHETNQYEDVSFPFGLYRVNINGISPPGRGYMDLHWHEELQFTLVTAGQVTIEVNGKAYHLSQGEAIFINSGFLHITTKISLDGEYISLNFPDKLLSFFPGSRLGQEYVYPYTTNYTLPVTIFQRSSAWQCKILDYLSELEQLIERKERFGWEYLLSLKTAAMWYVMIENLADTTPKTPKNFIRKQQRIQALLSFIHQHYPENITLQDIAAAAHVSSGECCRCFKTMLHTTPKDYLLNYRIHKSMDLLTTTDYTITEISGLVGFNSASHYIQQFKDKVHKTPKEYRFSPC